VEEGRRLTLADAENDDVATIDMNGKLDELFKLVKLVKLSSPGSLLLVFLLPSLSGSAAGKSRSMTEE